MLKSIRKYSQAIERLTWVRWEAYCSSHHLELFPLQHSKQTWRHMTMVLPKIRKQRPKGRETEQVSWSFLRLESLWWIGMMWKKGRACKSNTGFYLLYSLNFVLMKNVSLFSHSLSSLVVQNTYFQHLQNPAEKKKLSMFSWLRVESWEFCPCQLNGSVEAVA